MIMRELNMREFAAIWNAVARAPEFDTMRASNQWIAKEAGLSYDEEADLNSAIAFCHVVGAACIGHAEFLDAVVKMRDEGTLTDEAMERAHQASFLRACHQVGVPTLAAAPK